MYGTLGSMRGWQRHFHTKSLCGGPLCMVRLVKVILFEDLKYIIFLNLPLTMAGSMCGTLCMLTGKTL